MDYWYYAVLKRGHPSYKANPTKGHSSDQGRFQMHYWYYTVLLKRGYTS
jgi:hypothetical protein